MGVNIYDGQHGGGSMRQTEILLDELNRVFGGNAWHGPALRNLLD